jgi:hypothetical protein
MFMMKSRIVFLCTLAAFLSPMSVMANGTKDISENGVAGSTSDITRLTAGMTQCEKYAKDVTGMNVTYDESGKVVLKSGSAH